MRTRNIIIIAGTAILSLSACTREQIPVREGSVTVNAIRESSYPNTRTALNEELGITWQEGDQIGVFNGENRSAFTLSSGSGTGEASFNGNIGFTEGKLYAYYPYSAENLSQSKIGIDLSSQSYSSAADFGKYFTMAGVTEVTSEDSEVNVSFKNPLAAFVFKVTNNLDESIKVTGISVRTEDAVFYTKASLDLDGSDICAVTTEGTAASSVDALVNNIAVASGNTASFPLTVLPCDLSDKTVGFTLKFKRGDSDEELWISKSLSGKNLPRNTFAVVSYALDNSTVSGSVEGSSEKFEDALTNGESYSLDYNISLPSGTVITAKDGSVIDLNGHTLTLEEDSTAPIVVTSGTVTIKGGTISAPNYSNPVNGGLSAIGNGELIVEDVEFESTGVAFYVQDEGTLTIKNSNISAPAYCVASNASSADQNINVTIENSTLSGSDPILLNVPSTITVTGCTLKGTMHAMIVRGGTATISNSTLTLEYPDDDYETISSYFESIDWGTGNMVNIAALTLGNKSSNAYQYPTTVSLVDTDVKSIGEHASYFPAVYVYANSGDGLGVTFSYDDYCNFEGELIYGSDNITVNGEPVEAGTVENEGN